MIASKTFDYSITEYNNYSIREVITKDGPNGEYHISLKKESDLNNAVRFFKGQFPGNEIGLVDPTETLKLDYPIYMKITDPMVNESVHDILEFSDNLFGK
jgi:hypothetical protein